MSEVRFGRVLTWNAVAGWGVIERSDSGEPVFCPLASVHGGQPLARGQGVLFTQTMDHRGRHLAKNVRLANPES